MNAHVVDRRLPGGEAFGKITGYASMPRGDGRLRRRPHHRLRHRARRQRLSAAAGTPTYVDAGYVAAGYQQMTGAEITLPTGDLVYQSLG